VRQKPRSRHEEGGRADAAVLSKFRDLEEFRGVRVRPDRLPAPQLDRGAGWLSCSSSRVPIRFRLREEGVSIWAGTTGQLTTCASRTEAVRERVHRLTERSSGGLLTAIREDPSKP